MMPDFVDTVETPGESLTALLRSWRQGSGTAFGTLIDQVYDQLRALAARRLSQSSGCATLIAAHAGRRAGCLEGAGPGPRGGTQRALYPLSHVTETTGLLVAIFSTSCGFAVGFAMKNLSESFQLASRMSP